MQAYHIVMVHEFEDEPLGIFHAQRRLDANAPSLQRFEPPLQLAVALGIVWRCSDVRHSTDPDEFLEVPGDELRAVIRDDARPLAWKLFASALDDRLHLGFLHVRA